MKIAYVERTFYGKARTTIEKANEIINDYAEQGFALTLRQLYTSSFPAGCCRTRSGTTSSSATSSTTDGSPD